MSRRAVATLKTFVTYECRLQRMQLVTFCQTFNRCDFAVVVDHRERETRVDTSAVDDDGAGAALAVIAALLRPGKIELFTQKIEQGSTRIETQSSFVPLTRKRTATVSVADG